MCVSLTFKAHANQHVQEDNKTLWTALCQYILKLRWNSLLKTKLLKLMRKNNIRICIYIFENLISKFQTKLPPKVASKIIHIYYMCMCVPVYMYIHTKLCWEKLKRSGYKDMLIFYLFIKGQYSSDVNSQISV